MRTRKAVPVAFPEPTLDEGGNPFPSDEPSAGDGAPFEEPLSFDHVCLECGGGHDGCEHLERVSFLLPSPVIRSKIERLRRAAAEHRAAMRALRALSISENARGRADLERAPPPRESEPPPWLEAPAPAPLIESVKIEPAPALVESAAPAPCPRCAEREAAAKSEATEAPTAAPRRARKKPQATPVQHSFPFLNEAEPLPPALSG